MRPFLLRKYRFDFSTAIRGPRLVVLRPLQYNFVARFSTAHHQPNAPGKSITIW